MPANDLRALFLRELKDTYSAENTIVKNLPEIAEAARSAELRAALNVHLGETKKQVERLDQVFKMVGEKPEEVPCKGVQALFEEGQEIVDELKESEALDAGLIAAVQSVEHYEITRYGTLMAWAKQLGLGEAESLLKETLVEEENADELLSELAEDAINPAAA